MPLHQLRIALLWVECVSEAADADNAVERGKRQLRQGALEEPLAPIDRCDSLQRIDYYRCPKQLQWEVIFRVWAGSCKRDGREETANQE